MDVLNEMNRRLAGQSFPSRVLKEKMENSFVTTPFWTRTLKVIKYKSRVELFLWKSIWDLGYPTFDDGLSYFHGQNKYKIRAIVPWVKHSVRHE